MRSNDRAAVAESPATAAEWNEYDSATLGENIGATVSEMIRERDAEIEELRRALALAEAEIDRLRGKPE